MPLIMKFARQEDDELKEHVLQVNYISFVISSFVSSRVSDPETRMDPHCFWKLDPDPETRMDPRIKVKIQKL